MKNALDFGFRAGNDPRENAAALQNAVAGGGEIVIPAGVYEIAGTVVLESHTTLCFEKGAVLCRTQPKDGILGYTFVNRGAYTREYDEDITILGMTLHCCGVDTSPKAENAIPGLRGQLSFFYVKDLVIRDFTCPDLLSYGFCIQICTFENVTVENVAISGKKDGVHFGKGKNFTLRHGRFCTFDDPVALNAHDYATSNPQLGWIENGLIEDCYDLDADSTTGYFCRILAGSWSDWKEGMEVQHSDTVVHGGRLYRVIAEPDGTLYRSLTPPTHEKGTAAYDGISWVMIQDEEVIYNCGCRNIHFKDIHLAKKRNVGISIHFDNDRFSRSVYPDSEMPIQRDLLFENIYTENEVEKMLSTVSPVQNAVFKNCTIGASRFVFPALPRENIQYPVSSVRFENVHFAAPEAGIYRCSAKREVALTFENCTAEKDFALQADETVRVLDADIKIV